MTLSTIDNFLTAQRDKSAPQGWISDAEEIPNDPGVDHGTMVLRNPSTYGMPEEVAHDILMESDWEVEYRMVLDWMFENGWIRYWFGYGYAGFDMPSFDRHYTKLVRDFLLENPINAGGDVTFDSYAPKQTATMKYREFVFDEQEPGRGMALGQRALIDRKNLVMMTHRKAQAMRWATDTVGKREYAACLKTLQRLKLGSLITE